jgi:hypothetical protein
MRVRVGEELVLSECVAYKPLLHPIAFLVTKVVFRVVVSEHVIRYDEAIFRLGVGNAVGVVVVLRGSFNKDSLLN